MKQWGQFLARTRRGWWVWPLVWLLLTGVAVKTLPNLTQVAQNQSQSLLPASAEPTVAQHYLNRIGSSGAASGQQVLVVLHSAHRLTAHDRSLFARRLHTLDAKHQVGPAPARGASPFVSKRGRTDFAVVTLPAHAALTPAVQRITRALGTLGPGLHTAVTGSSVIAQAVSQTDLNGLNRMLVVTLVLVLAIMLFVFRGPIAPLVSLLAIGTGFVLTSGLVAWLGQHGLTVSTYTQTFLIAIMFGAGTDYSILMMSRFREELQHTRDVSAALARTMGAVGPTALVAAATLMLAFMAVDLAHFTLYRSAVGVAVGVAVIAVELLTVVPALLLGLGPRLFWPSAPVIGGNVAGGGTWARLADRVVRQPAWALVPAAVLAVLAYVGSGPLSFNEIQQLPQNLPSVAAFTWIEHGFGGGEVLPLSVVLHDPHQSFRSVAGLETLAHVSEALGAEPGVKAVEGPTRPLGTPLAAIQISTEARSAASGVAKMTAALDAIYAGLKQGAAEGAGVTSSLPKLSGGLGHLTVASQVITSGLSKSQSADVALNQASLSLYQGLAGLHGALAQADTSAAALSQGAEALSHAADAASTGTAALASGAQSLAGGDESLSTSMAQLNQGLAAAAAKLSQVTAEAAALVQTDPSLANSPTYQAMVQNVAAESTLIQSLAQAADALTQGTALTAGESAKLAQGISGLNQSLAELSSGTAALASHLSSWSAGAAQLAALSGQLASGAGALHGGIGQLASGTGQLAAGSKALTGGLAEAETSVALGSGQATHLLAGLTAASQGTKTVAVDLKQLGTLFLTPLASQSGTGTIISPQLVSDAQFKPVVNAFVSPAGHVATLTVVLSQNPYSASAMNRLPILTAAVHRALAGGAYQHAAVYLGGSTSQSVALDHLSNQDFGQTALLVLLVIGVMLLILLRSVLAPIVLLGLVSLNYFATTRIAAWVAIGWLHQTGLSWTAPFFSFLLLVALGVDYVIFYMARFREEEHGPMAVALVRTSRLAGPVVFSAALIMAGTFGSMAASGATDLMEIGITVVIGLGLDLLFVMGITAPAALELLGPVLHWPFGPVAAGRKAAAEG